MPAAARDPDRTRTAILAATAELIGTHGLEATRHRAIAEQAGVSLGSLSNHFSTREELLHGALHYLSAIERQRLDQWALSLQTSALNLEEWLARIAREVALDVQSNRTRWLALVELQLACARDPKLRPAMETLRDSYRTALTLGFRAAGFADPASVADQTIAAATGLILKHLAYPSDDFETRLQTLIVALVSGTKEERGHHDYDDNGRR